MERTLLTSCSGTAMAQGAAFGNQTTGSLVISGPVSGKQTYRAFYFGDTWHVTTKLTLNLGVRYELQGPWSERYDKMTYFQPQRHQLLRNGLQRHGGKRVSGRSFPGQDRRELQPQQSSALEQGGPAATWIRLFTEPKDCDPRRLRHLLHSELCIIRYKPVCRSSQQLDFELLFEQQSGCNSSRHAQRQHVHSGRRITICPVLGAGPFNEGQAGAGANNLTPSPAEILSPTSPNIF